MTREKELLEKGKLVEEILSKLLDSNSVDKILQHYHFTNDLKEALIKLKDLKDEAFLIGKEDFAKTLYLLASM